MADINMVYVTPINCRLIQPTDGSLAYVIQQDATTQEWSRYDPSIRSWIKDDSVSQLSMNPMDVQIPAAALSTTVKYVQTLFDSGASHTMVSNAKYFVPHTMINLNGSFARTASGQKMPVVAVGQIRQCKLAMYIPALTKNLVAPSHICRDGAWPGQFSMNTVTLINSRTKEFQSAFQIRQHHYCPADGSLQERVPYQILVTALCENQNLYYMPDSWLEKQPHLLKKGGN